MNACVRGRGIQLALAVSGRRLHGDVRIIGVPTTACHGSTTMRPLLYSLLACAALSTCAIATAPGSARATTGVARCALPDGSIAYTDVACTGLGGRHVAMPADMQNRIRSERRREASLTGTVLPAGGLFAGGIADTPRPRARGCATSPRQLAVDLRASMAQRDVNRIAENFDWAGMSHAEGMRWMARIERLLGLALVDAEYFGATFAGDPGAGADGGTLQVLLEDAGGQTVTDFEVRRTGGCYFLQHRWAV